MCTRRLYFFPLLLLLSLTVAGEAQTDDPTLAAYWRLDEGAGTKVGDSSRNGNDGALYAGAAWTAGASKTGVYLDGVDDYIEVPNVLTEAGTIGFWFKPDWNGSDPEDYRLFDASFGGIYFFISKGANHTDISPQYFGFYLEDASDADYQGIEFDPAGVIFADTWFHVAATWEFGGGPAVLYLDGKEMSRAATLGGFPTLSPNLRFGYETITYIPMRHGAMGVIDEIMIYNRALAAEEIPSLMVTSPPELAGDPRPTDGAVDVPRDVVLGWRPGEFAAAHDVYFGPSFDDVNSASRSNPRGVLISQGQSAAACDPPGVLDFEKTYYWRVDEVNAPPDSTIFRGPVWSFTAEPLAYPVANIIATSNGISDDEFGPENTVNGSGLDAAGRHSVQDTHMWAAAPGAEPLYIQYEFDRVYKLHEMLVWNYNSMFELVLGFGLKSVTIEYSENGADWTALGDFVFARATAKATYTANTTVDFGGVPARFVRLNINSGYGMMGQFGLSEVRFMFIPAHAREPQPADGAADVEVGTDLAWRSGREAVSHRVYLGTDPTALTLAGTVSTAAFSPGNLEFGNTYYWQVDEVNEAEVTAVWGGDVWTFSTQEYAWIDGFETYNDDLEAGTAIFDTWLDGWVNDTGSTVGYLNAPFAEQTIVHGGRQSMPLAYDNATSPFYSEAERRFGTAQDWSGHGADRIVLHVRGNAPAFVETAGGQIIMSAVGTDIWDTADQFRYAYKSLSGNGSIMVRVDSLVRSNEWAKAGVMIRETLEAGSKHAFVAVTPEPSHGVSFQRRPLAGQASANTDVANVAIPRWVKLTRTGNVFTAQQSSDGVTWTDIVVSPSLEIVMAANVYIGLAVCSHDAAIVTAAEFSNLSMTGSVTGAWQTAEIGVAQPRGNSAEAMYVRIEDSAGKSATVVNGDSAITQRPTWQEWSIPYSDLSGVNLGRVSKMIVGVGSRTAPAAGGTGTVYVDDIGFGRPAAP